MYVLGNKTYTKTQAFFFVALAFAVELFLWPALFRLIWNWQFSDLYIFSYWQAFWFAMAIKFVVRISGGQTRNS